MVEKSRSCLRRQNKLFYIYAYLDPRRSGKFVYGDFEFDHEPFYIGKGINRRKRYGKRNYFFNNKVNKMRLVDKKPIVVNIMNKLTEEEAFGLETELIKIIGRANLSEGPLTNLTDGGEGVSGYVFPEARKKEYSKKFRGLGNPAYGKHWKLNDETKEKMSIAHKGKKFTNEHKRNLSKASMGKNGTMVGRSHSEETKRKISEILMGQKRSDETKIKMSKAAKERYRDAKNHPMFGRKHTDETKKKISISRSGGSSWNMGKKTPDVTKKKISETLKGNIPWNKGLNKEQMLQKRGLNEAAYNRKQLF